MLAAVDIGGTKDSKFKGIGIACPGPLDPATGIIGNVGPEQCRLSISERARRSDAFSYLIAQIYSGVELY
jgi:hypothetical protein